jgi:hypothetical protein
MSEALSKLLDDAMLEMKGIITWPPRSACPPDGILVHIQHERFSRSVEDLRWQQEARVRLGQVAYLMCKHFRTAARIEIRFFAGSTFPMTYSIRAAAEQEAKRMGMATCLRACCIILRCAPHKTPKDLRVMLAQMLWTTRGNRKWPWETRKVFEGRYP